VAKGATCALPNIQDAGKFEPDAGFPAARLSPLAPRGYLGGPARLRIVVSNIAETVAGATEKFCLLMFINGLTE
jgi:hypothetical protein